MRTTPKTRTTSLALLALAAGAITFAACKSKRPDNSGSGGGVTTASATPSGGSAAASASTAGTTESGSTTSSAGSGAAGGASGSGSASGSGNASGSGSAAATATSAAPAPHKAEIKPTNKRPGTRLIQRLSAKVALGVRAHDRGKALGGTRWVSAVSGRKKKGEPFTTFLVVLDQTNGSWKLVESKEVAQQKPDESGMCPRRLPVSLFTSDYDWDGKPEVLVRYRTCTVEAVVGQSTNTFMAIYNAQGRLQDALTAAELQASAGSGGTKVKTSYVDVNKDGFPDVRIRTTSLGTWADDKGDNTSVVVYLYDPRTDGYAIKSRKRKRATK